MSGYVAIGFCGEDLLFRTIGDENLLAFRWPGDDFTSRIDNAALARIPPCHHLGYLAALIIRYFPGHAGYMLRCKDGTYIDHLSGSLRCESSRQKRMEGYIRSRPGHNMDLRVQLHERVVGQDHIVFSAVEAADSTIRPLIDHQVVFYSWE